MWRPGKSISKEIVAGACALVILLLLPPGVPAFRALAACAPILTVLLLMVGFHWPGKRAGPLGWLVGLIVAWRLFGLTLDVAWVSQAKGLVITGLVLAVLWPALLLYHVVDQASGIDAVAGALRRLIVDDGLMLIVLAWAFTGLLEGLAGYGLPIAIVAPMLVNLGVKPVRAVAAAAVGNAWAATFGNMGVLFQSLTQLVKVDPVQLASASALMLGLCCLLCGLAVMRLLELRGYVRSIVVLALVMGLTQYGIAVSALAPLAALLAGLSGVIGAILISRWRNLPSLAALLERRKASGSVALSRPLLGALASYGLLTVLLATIALVHPVGAALNQVALPIAFPQVTNAQGVVTAAPSTQVIRPFGHPGMAILLIALLSFIVYRRRHLLASADGPIVLRRTYRAALPATIGILVMVGLSTLMDHSGMTLLLAQVVSQMLGSKFPVVSPLVGMVGAFATGSANNSNVLFAPLQQNVAILLGLAPVILVAAQTAGGSIGAMTAPAKIIVGLTTVGLHHRDGEVLRLTLPYGVGIGLFLGMLTLLLSHTW